MIYALKTTGIPAAYTIKACLVVDDDGTTIVDLVGNAITRDGAVTISTGSWNGTARNYFSTFGSGFSPQAISWNTPLSIATASGFSVYAAFHSINSGIGTGWALLAESAASNRINALWTSGGTYKPSHEFSNSEFYVASTAYNNSAKISLLFRGIQNGAQSTRGANHGSALASLGSGSDPGVMPGTWSPNQLCGQPSTNYLAADIYAILVIQGTLSDADADLLHADWFAELIDTGATPQLAYPIADVSNAGWRRKGPGTEAVRNLLTYTESFDQIWTTESSPTGLTASVNSAIDPNGDSTAETLVVGTGGAGSTHSLQRNVSLTATLDYCFSCFVSANAKDWVLLQVIDLTGTSCHAYFNVSSGTVGTTVGCTPSVASAANSFFRCALVMNASTGAFGAIHVRVWIASADNNTTFSDSGSNALNVWGAQFEQASSPSTYQPILATTPPLEDSATDLYTAVGESPRNDNNYIYVTAPGVACEFQLTPIDDPTESGTYSYIIPALSPQGRSLQCDAKYGGSIIATRVFVNVPGLTDWVFTLTAPEIASIAPGTFGGNFVLTGL